DQAPEPGFCWKKHRQNAIFRKITVWKGISRKFLFFQMTEGAGRGRERGHGGPDHRAARPMAWPRHYATGPTTLFASFSSRTPSSRKPKRERTSRRVTSVSAGRRTPERKELSGGQESAGEIPSGGGNRRHHHRHRAGHHLHHHHHHHHLHHLHRHHHRCTSSAIRLRMLARGIITSIETFIETACQHLLLLVGFDTLIYRKYYDTPPILVGHQDYFLAPLPGSEALLRSSLQFLFGKSTTTATVVDEAPGEEVVPYKIPMKIIERVMDNRYEGDGTVHPGDHLLFLHELCGLFKCAGISMNEVRKKLFTISLSGKAAHWYKLLKNGDSIDWEDIVPLFYSKFYPP
ncbi:hypothetical protein QYE76_000048, partial [Lolium multiflorum]